MKLKNKKTGEIGEINYYDNCIQVVDTNSQLCGNSILGDYRSLAELCEEWEDYKEPEYYWFIRDGGNIDRANIDFSMTKRHKELGNYFESKEDAELAVRRLKVLKVLKDRLIDSKFTYEFDEIAEDVHSYFNFSIGSYPSISKDLDLLFGDKNANK